MLKGTAKTIIEMPAQESDCFDRIIFCLKPNLPRNARRAIQQEAKALLSGIAPPRPAAFLRLWLCRLFCAAAFAAVGGAAVYLWLK